VPASALALVLLAGLIHASWNIAAKKAGGDVRFATFTGLVMMVFWAPLGLWLGLDQIPAWGRTEWLLVATSAALHTLYYIVLLRGYRKADLTVVYPLARLRENAGVAQGRCSPRWPPYCFSASTFQRWVRPASPVWWSVYSSSQAGPACGAPRMIRSAGSAYTRACSTA
jgi:hypothetical protein